MKKLLSPSVFFLVLTLLLTAFISRSSFVYAATASHLVISEVQIGGGVSTDEFVELYNPTNSNVDVTGWRLTKKTATGTESDLVLDFPAKTINAHGYLLLAHTDYDGTPVEDITYSDNSVATNNSVLLYNASDVVVDKVGFGTATDVEGTGKTNPATNDSAERKASGTSDATTLAVGGTEETAGNGEDTDNNANDFVNRAEPQPQNISSSAEPVTEGTPTVTPTGSTTPTVTQTVTPTGSITSTPTGSPTATVSVSPTATVSVTNTPTPTVTATGTPTQTPTATVSPTASVTVTATPSATKTPTPTLTPSPTGTPRGVVFGTFIFPNKTIVCRADFKVRTSRLFIMYIPVFTCSQV